MKKKLLHLGVMFAFFAAMPSNIRAQGASSQKALTGKALINKQLVDLKRDHATQINELMKLRKVENRKNARDKLNQTVELREMHDAAKQTIINNNQRLQPDEQLQPAELRKVLSNLQNEQNKEVSAREAEWREVFDKNKKAYREKEHEVNKIYADKRKNLLKELHSKK